MLLVTWTLLCFAPLFFFLSSNIHFRSFCGVETYASNVASLNIFQRLLRMMHIVPQQQMRFLDNTHGDTIHGDTLCHNDFGSQENL